MGKRFLIDTNVLIDFQSKFLPEDGLNFTTNIINEDFTISFVSYIEFLGYKNTTEAMENFISLATVIETNKEIIQQTIALRRKYRIKLPDAIIAATALVYNQTLISRNTIDFSEINGLLVVNPYQLQ